MIYDVESWLFRSFLRGMVRMGATAERVMLVAEIPGRPGVWTAVDAYNHLKEVRWPSSSGVAV